MTSNIFSHWQQVQEHKKPQTPIFQCAVIVPGKRWSQEVSSIHYYLSDILWDVGEGVKFEIKTAEFYAKMTDGLQSLQLDTTLLVGCKLDRKSLDFELFRQGHHLRRSSPAAKGFNWRLNWSKDWTLSCHDLCDLQGRIWLQHYPYFCICRTEKNILPRLFIFQLSWEKDSI